MPGTVLACHVCNKDLLYFKVPPTRIKPVFAELITTTKVQHLREKHDNMSPKQALSFLYCSVIYYSSEEDDDDLTDV